MTKRRQTASVAKTHTPRCTFRWTTTLLALAFFGACSSPVEPDGGMLDGDIEEVDGDVARPDSDIEGPDDVPRCGDGVLDPGEECDDRNRLDGDGCDWLCRLGDGDPPLEPDPDAVSFEPTGPAEVIEGVTPDTSSIARLPLVWTGAELATVVIGDRGDYERTLDFHRFDRDGRHLDDDFEVMTQCSIGRTDLVWTGEELALFYGELWGGAFMRRLDPRGKPLSPPILLFEDPCVHALGATQASSGYGVAYDLRDYEAGPWEIPCIGEGTNPDMGVHLSTHDGTEGTLLSGPLSIRDGRAQHPDVAAGPHGFGVTGVFATIPSNGRYEAFFSHVDPALGSVETELVLSPAEPPPSILFDGEEYWVAWTHADGSDSSVAHEVCLARFAATGSMDAAPVCSRPVGSDRFDMPVIAAGDRGLGLVVATESRLLFQRYDERGVPVGEAIDVESFSSLGGYRHGPYAIVWADGVFAVLYSGHSRDPLRLRLFGPSPTG